MSGIYDRNVAALKKKNQELYDAYMEYVRSTNGALCDLVCVEKSKSGEDIIGVNCGGQVRFLCSKYNVAREADKLLAETYSMPDEAYLCMFGLANGGFVRQFFTRNNNANAVIVYEPDVSIFDAVMHEIDVEDILSNPRFFIVVNGLNEGYFAAFLSSYTNRVNEKYNRFVSIPVYEQLYAEQYEYHRKTCRDAVVNYLVQQNTLEKGGKTTVAAGLRNMKYIPGCRSGADYIGKFPKELPVIIVAAGPSLEKNVELLKEVKGRAVIIVVDSAIRTVMSRGIIPDFVIAVDSKKELKNFEAAGLDEVFFLADSEFNPDALDMVKPKNLIFYSSNFGNWKSLFALRGSEIKEIFAGGSVALSAMAVALYWGFKKIIMIGQDLAMTGDKQYADGVVLNGKPADSTPTLVIKDIYGNEVTTKQDYYTYIKDIENLAYKHPEVEFIDATEGGAFKENTRIMTLRTAIDTYCKNKYDIENIIAGVPRLYGFDEGAIIKAKMQETKRNLDALRVSLSAAVSDVRAGVAAFESKNYDMEILRRANNSIAEADSTYSMSEEKGLINVMAFKAAYEYESEIVNAKEDDNEEAVRLYNCSMKLYEGLIKGIDELKALIEEL